MVAASSIAKDCEQFPACMSFTLVSMIAMHCVKAETTENGAKQEKTRLRLNRQEKTGTKIATRTHRVVGTVGKHNDRLTGEVARRGGVTDQYPGTATRRPENSIHSCRVQ